MRPFTCVQGHADQTQPGHLRPSISCRYLRSRAHCGCSSPPGAIPLPPKLCPCGQSSPILPLVVLTAPSYRGYRPPWPAYPIQCFRLRPIRRTPIACPPMYPLAAVPLLAFRRDSGPTQFRQLQSPQPQPYPLRLFRYSAFRPVQVLSIAAFPIEPSPRESNHSQHGVSAPITPNPCLPSAAYLINTCRLHSNHFSCGHPIRFFPYRLHDLYRLSRPVCSSSSLDSLIHCGHATLHRATRLVSPTLHCGLSRSLATVHPPGIQVPCGQSVPLHSQRIQASVPLAHPLRPFRCPPSASDPCVPFAAVPLHSPEDNAFLLYRGRSPPSRPDPFRCSTLRPVFSSHLVTVAILYGHSHPHGSGPARSWPSLCPLLHRGQYALFASGPGRNCPLQSAAASPALPSPWCSCFSTTAYRLVSPRHLRPPVSSPAACRFGSIPA